MPKISIYLKSGQTITFDGSHEVTVSGTGAMVRHVFIPDRGFKISGLQQDMIVVVTEQDEWA